MSLQSIFGPQSMGEKIRGLNIVANDDPVSIPYAPMYKGFNKEIFEKFSPELKIAMAGVAKTMQKIEPDQRNFDTLTAAFMQNPLLMPNNEHTLSRNDSWVASSSADFKFDGSPDPKVVQQVEAWIVKFIGNEVDLLDTAHIGAEALAKIVAQTGATVTGPQDVLRKDEDHQKAIDLAFLRFPSGDRPVFSLYRLHLDAWSRSERILYHQKDQSGIAGEFSCRSYEPNKVVLESLSGPARDKAVSFAQGLFA